MGFVSGCICYQARALHNRKLHRPLFQTRGYIILRTSCLCACPLRGKLDAVACAGRKKGGSGGPRDPVAPGMVVVAQARRVG